jgi:predicted Ser/Thr protein kinase
MIEQPQLTVRPSPDWAGRPDDLRRQERRAEAGAHPAAADLASFTDLLSLLLCDQEERWLAGERVCAEEYLASYPALHQAPDWALELIYTEFLLRERWGEDPSPDEFAARFPAYASRLRRQIELHRALADSAPPTILAPPPSEEQSVPTCLAGRGTPSDGDRPSLPGYELVRELGRGGMGIVYEARDSRGRTVALKIMRRADPALLYRFKREFRVLAELNHPHLVALHELIGDEEQWFFTMELLDGVNFLAHVRGGGPSRPLRTAEQLARLRETLARLAEGLLALHTAGKLHRDIKPGNVLVTREGRVVLLDFGLAAELDRSGRYLSQHPGLLGTCEYMAPEQAAVHPVSPASDWYALGVMLFEALTARLPFTGTMWEVLSAKRELDAPSPADLVPGVPDDLADLCQALLRRDPSERPSGAEVLRRLRGAPGPEDESPLVGGETPLVGRRRHLTALAAAFAEARQGRTVVVTINGYSGAGKSALLRCFLEGLTERGEAVVLAGRCYEQESVPYKALDSLIDALSSYLEGLSRLEGEALLPRDIHALARAFPVLRRVEAVAAAPRRPGGASPQEERRRALAALRELLARIGDRRSLVLAIDDLQWGDLDSAALLADLLAPPDPPPLLLVGCYRREDAADSPALLAFARLAPEVRRHELAVEPLGPEDLRDLVRTLLGPDAERHATVIACQSGGYPFFVHELVRYLQEGSALGTGSAAEVTLSAVLAARVQRLPVEARRLLEVVAVSGRPVSADDACQAAGVADAAPRALACLRSARLLRSTGPADRGEVETYHDRVRETVAAQLSPAQRCRHHERLAEVLEAAGVCDPERLAVHWQEAGEPLRAGSYAALAAVQAAEALAFDRAAQLYRLALALLRPNGDEERRLRTRLGDALAGAGRGAEAAEQYLAAAAGADTDESLELQRRAAQHLLSSGHIDAGLSALGGVLGAVGLCLPATPQRAFWALVGQRLRLRLRGLAFRSRLASAVPAAELRPLDVSLSAAVGLSMIEPIQAAYFQSRSLLLALRVGEPGRLVFALAMEAAHESIGGTHNRRRTDTLLRAAEALARQDGRPYPRAVVVLAQGIAAALEGDWPRGRALCDEAEGLLRESATVAAWELGTAQRFALWPLMFMGEVAEMARRLPGLIQEARRRDDLYGETNLCLVIRTFLRLAADEAERARAELAEVMGRWSQKGFHVQHMNRLFDESQIDLYEGNGPGAWQRLTERWPLLERSHLLRVQQVRIFVRHIRGRAALAAAEATRRPELLRVAERDAGALRREGAPWARALAQLLYAGVAVSGGQQQRGVELLRDGARQCEAAGMHLFAAAARQRLASLVEGDEGQTLREAAQGWMASQQVKRPGRLAALLIPLGAVHQACPPPSGR